jgi:hypothetical protein
LLADVDKGCSRVSSSGMTEPRLNEALRRLRDRAAAAALTEDVKSANSEDLRAYVRQAIADEIRQSSLESTHDVRLRLSELERKVDELLQIIATLDSEPPLGLSAVENESLPSFEGGRIHKEPVRLHDTQRRPRPRGRTGRIVALLIIAVALATASLVLVVTGHVPFAVAALLDGVAQRFGGLTE